MSLFRQRALDKLQSPDRVDEVLQVIRRRDWIPLALIAGLLLITLAWSVVGRIPITAEGQAVLLSPSTVVGFQAPSSGHVLEWRVSAGDAVAVGDVLVVLDQPELRRELERTRIEAADLAVRHRQLAELAERAAALERDTLGRRRQLLEERIRIQTEELERSRVLTSELRRKSLAVLAEHERAAREIRRTSSILGDELQARVAAYEDLKRQGLASDQSLVTAREAAIANEQRLADLNLRLQEIERDQLRSEEEYQQAQQHQSEREATIADLTLQLREIESSEAQVDRRLAEEAFARDQELERLQRQINRFQADLEDDGTIRAERSGRLLEQLAQLGQRVEKGYRLGTIDLDPGDATLVCLAYFEGKDGKKITPGMAVRITPDTVQRERHGSLLGEVVRVSEFPVSAQAATSAIGNGAVAARLTAEGRHIEVHARLEPDEQTVSGLRWTSRGGAPTRITAGTTGVARVTIERRRPLSFILPLLRGATGLTGDAAGSS